MREKARHEKNYKDIAAVLFDLDGTLIEHTEELEDLCRDTFAAFEEKLTPVTQAEFWETYWPKNHDLWHMMVDGVLPGDMARLYSFVNTLRTLKADANLAQSMLDDEIQSLETRIEASNKALGLELKTVSKNVVSEVGNNKNDILFHFKKQSKEIKVVQYGIIGVFAFLVIIGVLSYFKIL